MDAFDELDEQAQQRWQDRIARKRLDLSASVEETLLDSSLQEDLEDLKADEVDATPSRAEGTMLIPPRLSLQSKPMPVVRPSTVPKSTRLLPTMGADVEAEIIHPENANLLTRFAQRLTSSLPSFGGRVQPAPTGETQSIPRIDSIGSAQPAAHTSTTSQTARSQAAKAKAPSRATEVSQPVQNKHRVLKHATKVRLQVASKPEVPQSLPEIDTALCDVPTNPSLPVVEKLAESTASPIQKSTLGLSGSGIFESGQGEVAVANIDIATSSVVAVVLTGDPGPVVIQYVSLQPGIGFTVHLSAPTKHKTPFNYKIL